MKLDTEKNLGKLTFADLRTTESEVKKFLTKINRAKRQLERTEAKRRAREVITTAKNILKAKEESLKDTLTKMGYTRDQIGQAISAMLTSATTPAPKAKRNRGPAKFIYTQPKTGDTYSGGRPPEWFQAMSTVEKEKIRKVNPKRTAWDKEKAKS